ncbi:MAG: hypothetical protein EKK41_19820 [Hyphomicrobiales bacterium]|nr:MAG: hypothetical protein EKK41_19820 [Hyphomicrobiales bacterium]
MGSRAPLVIFASLLAASVGASAGWGLHQFANPEPKAEACSLTERTLQQRGEREKETRTTETWRENPALMDTSWRQWPSLVDF